MGNSGSNVTQNASNVNQTHRYSRIHTASSWSALNHHNSGYSSAEDGVLQPVFPISIASRALAIEPTVKKRRNLASFATLKKKLGRKSKRTSKGFDHSQVMKDFISSWNTRDIAQLVEEYDAESIIKELHLQAEIARPSASTIAQDLTETFDCNYVADSYLVFKGHTFPVHKAIVCVRCPLFRELLGKVNEFGAQVTVNIDVPGLRPDFFLDLLRYLYSGELYTSSTLLHPLSSQTYDSILMKLSDQVPNSLEQDLKTLFETGLYSDAILVFASPSNSGSTSFQLHSKNIKKCRACSDQSEFSCHCVVLASRSNFFRNVISRYQKRFSEAKLSSQGSSMNTANHKIRIVLDESIIPRRFGRIILHCIYRDSTELTNLLPGCVCKCQNLSDMTQVPQSKSATYNTNSNGSLSSYLSSSISSFAKEIMELYEIGRFLELDTLIQSCEDMILDSLTLDNLVPILKWSEQPHGSPWVKRQALCFLREEFSAVASSAILYDLDSCHLKEAIKSDYLQASELEVLQAIIKWGENKLYQRMEEREPNLISQTSHSLRHGLRKKELNEEELRDLISEFMPYVRIGHIIPPDSEFLASAIKRGLISTLPPYMLEEDSLSPYSRGMACWLRGRISGIFIKPRYFTPYVEEARNFLEFRLTRQNENIFGRTSKSLPQPDSLYMVEESSYNQDFATENCTSRYSFLDAGASIHQLPVLEDRILVMMQQRLQELERYISTSRDLDLIPNKQEINKYIKLRVVREFGLPDAAASVQNFCDSLSEGDRSDSTPLEPPRTFDDVPLGQSYPRSHVVEGVLKNYDSSLELKINSLDLSNREPFRSNYSLNDETKASQRRNLSKFTPDIAMTSSAIEELQLFTRHDAHRSDSQSSVSRRSGIRNQDMNGA